MCLVECLVSKFGVDSKSPMLWLTAGAADIDVVLCMNWMLWAGVPYSTDVFLGVEACMCRDVDWSLVVCPVTWLYVCSQTQPGLVALKGVPLGSGALYECVHSLAFLAFYTSIIPTFYVSTIAYVSTDFAINWMYRQLCPTGWYGP